MKTIRQINSILENCLLNIKRFSIPEPNEFFCESDDVDGVMSFKWNKVTLEIYDRNIFVWTRTENWEFKDLGAAFKKVVEYA